MKSGNVMPLALFFFLKIALAPGGLLQFHKIFRIPFSIFSVNFHFFFNRDFVESTDCFV